MLKVTVGPSAAKLEKEYKIIQSIQNNPQTAHFVIPVVPDSFRYCRSSEVCCAGYLLEYEGVKFESSCPRLNNRMVANSSPLDVEITLVRSLLALHKSGIIHGDPRVDNVLLKNGQLKWIDFMESQYCDAHARVEDFVLLFSSLAGVAQANIRPTIREIIDPTTSRDSVSEVTRMLSQMNAGDPPEQLIAYLDVLW